jgi:hypothetical protein
LPTDADFCPKCGTPVVAAEAKPTPQHQTMKVTGKPKVVIVNRAPGRVHVQSGPQNEVSVDSYLREPEDLDWTVVQDGDVVTVRCRALVHPLRWPRYFASGGPRADVTVSVPKQADLELEAQIDEITVNGVEGTIAAESSVARVIMEDCKGTVRIRGRTGPVELRDVSGTVNVESTTGPITLENVNGTVSVRNRTGPIRYSGELSTAENWFRTSTGPVELMLTGTPDLTVEAYSRLGRVTLIPELADGRYMRGQYTGRIGSGKGRLIAETHTGSITIRR